MVLPAFVTDYFNPQQPKPEQQIEMAELKKDYLISIENNEINKMTIQLAIDRSRFQYYELNKLITENGITDFDQLVDGESSIAWAARRGHISVVKLLAELGANVNSLDWNGKTPLISIAKRDPTPEKAREKLEEVVDFVKLAELLIDRGANINQQDAERKTALMWAAAEGHKDMAKVLSDRGANINQQDADGKTALIWAVSNGYLVIVKDLIECGANLELKDSFGRTALMHAISREYVDIVSFLILHGANVDQQDNSGKTALMWAVLKSNEVIVSLLIGRGANVDLQDINKKTALMMTEDIVCRDIEFKNNSCRNIEKIINDRIFENNIWSAIDINSGDLEKIEGIAIKNNITDFNKPKDGEVPLVWAVGMNKPNIVKFLLEHKADVNQKGDDGRTALMLAALKGDMDILKLLIKSGANVDQKDNTGKTALMWAILGGGGDAAQLLIDNGGTNINQQDNDGNSALMLAIMDNQIDGVRFLLERRADVLLRNKEEITAYAVAYQYDCREGVKLFDEYLRNASFPNNYIGTDPILSPHPKRDNQMTFWDAVGRAYNDPKELVRLIKDDKITNFESKGGVSPTQWAKEQGYFDLIIAILEGTDPLKHTDEDKRVVMGLLDASKIVTN